ncbi:MAG: GbsR/MarR family transcriptional regulator [Anaerolineales bacterium]
MSETIANAREHFIQGMSRISNFWGFPRAMGAIYGAIYLSPNPISLDELVEQAGVSKGAVSTNVRQLERFNMVHRHLVVGDRKDYYTAETDFWKMIKSILEQREQNEFDKALGTVAESLEMAQQSDEDPELAAFYKDRMGAMQSFFKTLDSLFSAFLALEGLVTLSSLRAMLEKAGKK